MICKDPIFIHNFLSKEPGFTLYEKRKGIEYESLYFPEINYLYIDGCMFPTIVRNGRASVHACVPKNLRGKIAILAARKVINWLKERRYRVTCRIEKHRADVNRFARLVGAIKMGSDEEFNYYEAP